MKFAPFRLLIVVVVTPLLSVGPKVFHELYSDETEASPIKSPGNSGASNFPCSFPKLP
jgi:hypothetical protein